MTNFIFEILSFLLIVLGLVKNKERTPKLALIVYIILESAKISMLIAGGFMLKNDNVASQLSAPIYFLNVSNTVILAFILYRLFLAKEKR